MDSFLGINDCLSGILNWAKADAIPKTASSLASDNTELCFGVDSLLK